MFAVVLYPLVLALGAVAQPAYAQFNNTTPRADFAGPHDYQVTGGSLRRLPNGDRDNGDDDFNGVKDACEVVSSDTAMLAGIPTDGDATIAAAYLYWGGSGSTVDSTVFLNGSPVPVLQTFTENFNEAGYNLDYFGGVADVTAIVNAAGGNGAYTFSGLTVDTGGGGGSTDHCGPSAVVAGWALFVFYRDPDEPYRYSRIYDGLEYFRDAAVTTNQSGFRVPNFKDGKVTVVTWEGDPDADSSVPGASGSTENLVFETAFRSGNLPDPPNSCNVADELYSSKISNNLVGLCDTGSPGVDISTFDVTGFLDEGVDSASLTYSSGNDLVFLTAQVISTTNTPVIDLSVDKTHSGDFTVGGIGSYAIVVHNNGPETAVGDNTVSPARYTTVTDTLPTGLSFDSYSGAGWSCQVSGQEVTCENAADIPAGSSLPVLTINVAVAEEAIGTVSNTATVTHPMFDSDPLNDSDTDEVEVPNPAPPSSGNKQLYLLDGAVGATKSLTRTRPAGGGSITWSSGDGQYQYWQLPPLAADLTLQSSSVSVQVRGRRSGNSGNRWMRAQLFLNGTGAGSAISAESGDMNFNVSAYTTRTVNLTLDRTQFSAGDRIILRLRNRDNRDIEVTQRDGNNYSFVQLDALTVVNVDSMGFYEVPFTDPDPDQPKATWEPGETVYIRAVVSDPFGGFDVNAADSTLALVDADGGAPILSGATMTARTNPVEGDGVATRVLEYAYTIPSNASFGTWTATVTAAEGLEGAITHSRNAAFSVVPKALSVVKSHSGDFVAGMANDWILTVQNEGGAIPAGTTTTVEDRLATGLTFVSGTGSGWNCSAAGQDVTCTTTAAIPAGASLPPITLSVDVDGSLGDSVDNRASVGNSSIAGGYQKPGNIDTATILHPDLSGSTKTVEDRNDGEVAPGDVLRYTITLSESAGATATGVSVTDPLPANTTGLTVVSIPAGSVDGSDASQLSVTGITVPANGSVQIVFDVTVAAVTPGTTIANTATITNPGGPAVNPVAPTLTVLLSQAIEPAEGSKILYLRDDGTMSRVETSGPASGGFAIGGNGSASLTLTPALAGDLALAGGPATVTLQLNCTGGILCGFLSPNISVRLDVGGSTIASAPGQAITSSSVTTAVFSLDLPATTIPAGTPVVLVISNSGFVGTQVYQYNGGQSRISFETTTVINVDSVGVYAEPYPSTTTKAQYVQGDTLYVRAVVSDPFGAADITRAELTLTDAADTSLLTAASMPMVAEDAATRTFETAFVIPDNPRTGSWPARVRAVEGTEVEGDGEPSISHEGLVYATVHGVVTVGKSWEGAAAGDAVTLTIAGGSSTTAGSSTAGTPTVPGTTTQAVASAAPGATLTLAEAFTSGEAGHYTISLTCVRDVDDAAVPVAGTALSRNFEMPDDSAVTCTWRNAWTTPLGLVKLSTVVSDPINGTINPKAIPGAIVEYRLILTNPADVAVDPDSIVVTDMLPPEVQLLASDIGGLGSGPVAFEDGTPSSGLSYLFAGLGDTNDDVEFSSDGGATWTYVPIPGGDGADPVVDAIRIRPKGGFNPGNAQFTLKFRVRIP